MKPRAAAAYCLVVTGNYATVNEAFHALRDPFIEEWVERTGRFRVHQLDSLEVAPGVPLGQLIIEKESEGVFVIVSDDPDHPLTLRKATVVADALRYHAMFDELTIEPLAPPILD